ncbi:hypothetical protein D3C78_1403850 [compost metagenome]
MLNGVLGVCNRLLVQLVLEHGFIMMAFVALHKRVFGAVRAVLVLWARRKCMVMTADAVAGTVRRAQLQAQGLFAGDPVTNGD